MSRKYKVVPPEERKDRREEIMLRAVEVFGRKGFMQSSLKDIADELGITREAIYYYFPNKKQILLPMILGPSCAMLEDAEGIVRSDQGVVEKLKSCFVSHLKHFTPAYLEVSIALRESNLLEDDEFVELRRQWKRYEEIWLEIIRAGQAEGLFHEDLNPKAIVYGILGMCNWLSRWYRPDGPIGVSELVDNYFRMCAYGLVKEPAKNHGGETQ